MTVGADIGYNLTPNLKASLGYYYSEGDLGAGDGNSVRGRLEYNIANGLTSSINIAYDPAFSEGYSSGQFYKTLNLSVDIKYRFGANGYGAPSIRNKQPVAMPVIQAISATPANRNVRVHDNGGCWGDNLNEGTTSSWRGQFWSVDCWQGISYEWGAIKRGHEKWRSFYDTVDLGSWSRAGYSHDATVRPFKIFKTHNGQSTGIPLYQVIGVCQKPGVRC